MGATRRSASSWTRRRAATAGLLALTAALAPVDLGGGSGVVQAAADEPAMLFVSRKRLLNETNHAKQLHEAEVDLTAKLQAEVDDIKADLSAEEQELTRLRGKLERKLFDSRVAAFDHKVRTERRAAQEKAAKLQMAFRAERVKLVQALGPVLEEVREAHGASVILNADQALAADPALDVTDEAIARFNDSVPAPQLPDLESILAMPLPVPSGDDSGATANQ
jgi:outer membrane protein